LFAAFDEVHMPRLRSVRTPTVTETVPAKSHLFQKGHARISGSGRAKGTGNVIPGSAREAIALGLSMYGRDACGRPDLDGLSAFVYKCAEADLELGAKLLMCITPRTADIAVRREVEVRTIADLDAELQRQGLPASREIFALDFASNDDEVIEAELAAPAPPVSK
jgi:hypothetical protein